MSSSVSSEAIRQTSESSDDEMVPSAWRHAGMTIEGSRRPLVVNGIETSKISSEIPCRVSSDLHEWRNDLGAVSTRDPVKL